MRIRTTRALLVTGAAAGVLALGLSASSAATPFKVTAGHAAKGKTVAYLAKAGSVTLTDTRSMVSSVCTSSSAPGSIVTGSRPGLGISGIAGAKTKFNGCQVSGLGLQLFPKGVGTWKLNALGYSKGVVTGTLSNVVANITTSAPGCTFTVSTKTVKNSPAKTAALGIPVRYVNKTHKLSVLGTKAALTVSKVPSPGACFGVIGIQNGDKATIAATYTVNAVTKSFNPIHITR